jgi:hypothetical protein
MAASARELDSVLERRRHARARADARCELVVAGERHPATVVDASPGGILVECDATAFPGELVRVCSRGAERRAIVLRERHVPHRLRGHLPRALALRWVSARAAD